jgi:tetratricopeptide (TPR) repeat protein
VGALALSELPLPEARRQTVPALSLTTSDGTGLALSSLRSKTVVEDPLVLTELELAFDNPEDRTLEGRFSITLPEGAAISRFAMEIDGRWQEGEIVEKKRARTTYESFLHRRRDPALMERGAGNQFTVRVFPIPPRAKKRLILTYSETIDPSRPFTVKLGGLPRMETLDVDVFIGGDRVFSKHEKSFAPTGDLVLGPELVFAESAAAVAEAGLVSLRVQIPEQPAATGEIEGALILVDTSAGRARDLEHELEAVAAIVDALPQDTPVLVAGFDQEVHVAYEGSAGALGAASLDVLRRRRALGASNLGAALGSSRQLVAAHDLRRVILVTDGIASVGPREDGEIARYAAALADVGVARFDVLAMGSVRSTPTLRTIADAGPQRGVVAELTASPESLVSRLRSPTLPELAVEIPGARWQSAESVSGAQPGDSLVVHAEVDRREGEPLVVSVGGTPLAVPVRAVGSRKLLERAHAVAKIAELEGAPGSSEERDRTIVELSQRHRVLARGTALLVLETDDDYRTFGLDRHAKLDVLAIEEGKITTARSGRLALPSGSTSDAPGGSGAPQNLWGDEIGDAFGFGGLGLSGIGEGGGGRGDGIGLGNVGGIGHGTGRLAGTHRARPPRLRAGALEVSGALPPEVIQRIVRQNFGRFRLCYENALRDTPELAGRLTVRFVIQADGSVKPSTLASRDWSPAGARASLEDCVVRSFVTLSFPQPERGSVTVLYPIAFEPSSAPGRSEASRAAPDAPTRSPVLPPPTPPSRYEGIRSALAAGNAERALEEALSYHHDAPSDVLAYVALGEVAEAAQQPSLAARAYGSIVDLWGDRAELRRFAAERLEHVGDAGPRALAVDVYAAAVADRADQPSGHRLLAYAKLGVGDREGAFDAIQRGIEAAQRSPRGEPLRDLMRQDAALLAAALVKEQPSRRGELESRLAALGTLLETSPSVRFVLHWETDANDVDLHVTDALGQTANYGQRSLRSGGSLLADVTTGFGPEAFVIPSKGTAFPYSLRAHYFARGAMGFGMGKVQIVCHDGAGGVSVEDRPFVIQSEKADFDLGKVTSCPAAGRN